MGVRTTVAKGAVGLVSGTITIPQFGVAICLAVITDALLTKEVWTMEFIFIPEGYLLPVAILLGAFAVIGPVLSAWHLKNKSKHQFDKWLGFYGATMVADMVVTPSLGLVVMGVIAQKWIPDITPEQYLVFLPLVLLAVSYTALIVMNEGLTSAYEQIKKVLVDAKNIRDDMGKI